MVARHDSEITSVVYTVDYGGFVRDDWDIGIHVAGHHHLHTPIITSELLQKVKIA